MEMEIKEIKELVKCNNYKVAEYKRYYDYYKAKNPDIAARAKETHKVNNKIRNATARYIVDVATGYFLGKPIAYQSEDEALMDDLQDIFDYNDEQDHNYEVAKEMAIKGKSYEILYTDSNAKVRFKQVPPEQMILVREKTLEEKLLYAIRYWYELEKETSALYVEVYDENKVTKYKINSDREQLLSEDEHFFNDIPVIEYINNEELQGDIEPVIDLINEYDKLQSDTANDFEEFTDCYMVWKGYNGAVDPKSDEVISMKEARQIFLDADGSVEFLLKQINDTANENYKTRIMDDLHKLSLTPNITDEKFSSNASGIALKYKLYGLEQKTAIKERKMKKGLQRRIELICNFLNISKNYDYLSVTMQFTRNFIDNFTDVADGLVKISPFISQSTLLALLPFIDDVGYELEKIEQEQSEIQVNLFREPENEEVIEDAEE